MESLTLRPGLLLIASPMLEDPNFWRTVVLLCAHGEDGSFGLILNRPTTLTLREVLDVPVAYPLFMGGPVQPDTLHILHRLGDEIPEAQPVVDGIYWGGEVEALLDRLRTHPPSPEDMRFFWAMLVGLPASLRGSLKQADGSWRRQRLPTYSKMPRNSSGVRYCVAWVENMPCWPTFLTIRA